MRKALYACLLLLALSSAVLAGGVTINPGSEKTLSNSSADGGASGDNGNSTFRLSSDYSTSSKWIKAESQTAGVNSVGTGWANSRIYYDFLVGNNADKASNTVGAWVSYSVNWRGYQVILGSAGTNAKVVVELELRDMTAGSDVAVETIHKLDLNTHSFSDIFSIGSDFADSGNKVGTIAAVLKRGHTYRLTLRMSANVFVIVQSATPTICDYMDGFEGGGDGRVQLNTLSVKVGLDENETLKQVSDLQKRLTNLDNKVTSLEGEIAGLEKKVTSLEGDIVSLDSRVTGLDSKVTGLDHRVTGLEKKVTSLENHRHIYLTGPDPGQNSVMAESSGPMPPTRVIIAPKDGGVGVPPADAEPASKPSPRLDKPTPTRRPDER